MKRPRIKHKVGTSELGTTEVKSLKLISPGEAKTLLFNINQEYGINK